ncbi:hypothetical protein HDU77_002850 [Chytriomyces hyalinus]|nr:hypothetical protein HDU77_002850 [Chytriomyces hyalinus]
MASAPITLLARRVGKNVPKPEIEAVFSRYGPILEVQLTPGRSANLAVVKFARKKDAEQAVRGCNGVHWSDGSPIVSELDLAEDEDQDSGSAYVC